MRGKCKARLKLDDDGYVIDGFLEHCHSPPVYHRASDGLENTDSPYKSWQGPDVQRLHVFVSEWEEGFVLFATHQGKLQCKTEA
ncbi:jg8392 [Pararge aegeria aegeria]|uniref:Jg8392 protein n=1 Tax=Pararge aegeria aegeria TaxID=348720 RepID=A0A8S4SNU1_9NEOP|nr:jg8392 [Pararge aegeria aegeria]